MSHLGNTLELKTNPMVCNPKPSSGHRRGCLRNSSQVWILKRWGRSSACWLKCGESPRVRLQPLCLLKPLSLLLPPEATQHTNSPLHEVTQLNADSPTGSPKFLRLKNRNQWKQAKPAPEIVLLGLVQPTPGPGEAAAAPSPGEVSATPVPSPERVSPPTYPRLRVKEWQCRSSCLART